MNVTLGGMTRPYLLGAVATFHDIEKEKKVGPLMYTMADVMAHATDKFYLNQAYNYLADYRRKVAEYYGVRIGRTSGGKRDRLRAERRYYFRLIDEMMPFIKANLERLGSQELIMATPLADLEEQDRLRRAGEESARQLALAQLKKENTARTQLEYRMTPSGNVSADNGNDKGGGLNPMLLMIPIAAVGAYLALKH
jgi:hypothetical protein